MKKRYRILSVILAVITVFCSLSIASAAKSKEPELKFDGNGRFRIMHISDTHYTDFPFAESIAFIEKALDDYKPDLVVFGGDNIKGWFDTSVQLGTKAAIDQLVAPVEDRNIPFTYVYGNHDREAYLCPKTQQNRYYKAHSGCIVPGGYGSAFGKSNGNILIKDSEGKKDIFNVWLFDSGTKIKAGGKTTARGVTTAEIKWYEKKCGELKSANGGKPIPSVVFQHFGVEEVTKLFDENADGFRCGNGTYTLKPGITDAITNGVPGTVNTRMSTHLNKNCEIPTENNGEYSAFVRQGDVIGLFFGHTHANDFCGITDDNVIIGATLSAGGFNIASRFTDPQGNQVEARGLRVIDVDEADLLAGRGTGAVSSFSVYYSDYFKDSVEKYPSKYKGNDEHTFGEWIKIEFKYFADFLKSLFSFGR